MLLEKHLELCRRAHLGVSFVPETRAKQYVEEFSEQLRDDMEKVAALGGNADEYRAKYESLFVRWMSAKSNCLSTMITGGSNFPTRRAQKANNYENAAYQRLLDFREKYVERLLRDKRKAERANIDPIQEIREKIEVAEKRQELMKAVNKIVRQKASADEKVLQMRELGMSETNARALLSPGFANVIGFASFELTNNLANIHRMRERLAELEKRANAVRKEIEREDGITLVENTEADRLQIFFPSKPDSSTIQNLKSRGFKWSPSNGCWQRQLTDNARYAVKQILNKAQ